MESLPSPEQGRGNSKANPVSVMPSQGLSRHQRLTKTSQFRETYAQGQHVVGRYMVLWLRRGPDAGLRLGVVASRKVGNAVYRGRAKRRLREAYRRNRSQFNGDYDVVLVARRPIISAQWNDVIAELMALAERAGLIDKKHE